MSLDEFSGLPSWRSATVVMLPFEKIAACLKPTANYHGVGRGVNRGPARAASGASAST